MNPNSREDAWRELAAHFLELRYFEPDRLHTWFPSLRDNPEAERILSQDLDVEKIFRDSRLEGAPLPELISHADRDEERLLRTRNIWSLGLGASQTYRGYLRQLRKRDRANERGNTVYAAICAMRAAQRATSDGKRLTAEEKAIEDVKRLVDRLRNAIDFSEQDTIQWQTAINELVKISVHGFWSIEKRLLYDLQKVCLDHERVTYKVDVLKWIFSRGERPLRRPLSNLREVAMAKHLASAASRLTHVRLGGIERDRLTALIQNAAQLSESQMRERMRPVLKQTLQDVSLAPKSVPEHVALEKLIEESLDCIADRGYLTMGYLRDVISKNDLKVPDLGGVRDLWSGDQLLRADARLDVAMDGVYRRGEFYLRWLQLVSSFFFGTPTGRFATTFLIIPFGGAVVIVEGVLHIVHVIRGRTHSTASNAVDEEKIADVGSNHTATLERDASVFPLGEDGIGKSDPNEIAFLNPAVSAEGTLPNENWTSPLDWLPKDSDAIISVAPKTSDQAVNQILTRQIDTFYWVLILGFLLMALIHVTSFRRFSYRLFVSVGRLARALFIEAPLWIIHLPILHDLWSSKTFIHFWRFVAAPTIITILFGKVVPWVFQWRSLSWGWQVVMIIAASIVLNSRLGQDAVELTQEKVSKALHQVRARLVFALFGWVVDLFRVLLNILERVLYAVDEWLRFHSDENWLTIFSKAILGVVWSFVSFLIRIYVNLLIEPTFHPVKHFPVVTVAHKIFLPALIMIEGNMVHFLGQYVGTPIARSFTWFNIFFLPGFFGFAVWELKENWRLYEANRKKRLLPVSVGSHGETVARLIRPGFHSGTLPKIYGRLRRLERQDASFGRFTRLRSAHEQLHHAEHAIQCFVDREFIRLLQKCSVWRDYSLQCIEVEAASNSFSMDLQCVQLGDTLVQLRMQEQSGWLVASVSQSGWLNSLTLEQWNSFFNALEGFYRKCGVELVREQIESNFARDYPYDIDTLGLLIWPTARFDVEILAELKNEGVIRPTPVLPAGDSGLVPIDHARVLFSATHTDWNEWERLWTVSRDENSAETTPVFPTACIRGPIYPIVLADRELRSRVNELLTRPP